MIFISGAAAVPDAPHHLHLHGALRLLRGRPVRGGGGRPAAILLQEDGARVLGPGEGGAIRGLLRGAGCAQRKGKI